MKKFIDICQFTLVLFGMMICGLFLTSLFGLLPLNGNSHEWVIIAAQNIFAFILPAILTWKMCFKEAPFKVMEALHLPALKMIGITLLIYIVSLPALNQIVYWNQEMSLPEMFADFENWCREMEKQAEQLTLGLISSTEISPLVINILLIGILTGIGEEFFFRGGLQRMLTWSGVIPHLSIWLIAAIFSAIHLQFLGFIPRLLLGAFFGYLYWWSGNIWVNSFAHALNNSLVIVSSWCINKGLLSEAFDMWGVSDCGFPTSAAISAIATAIIIYILCSRGILKGHTTDTHSIQSNIIGNATESK